jgi:hypothetical protein
MKNEVRLSMLHVPKRSISVVARIIMVVAWASVGFAQGKHYRGPHPPAVPYVHIPPQVRLAGTLHPLEEKGAPVEAAKILVQDKAGNFWPTQVDTLTGTNYGW